MATQTPTLFKTIEELRTFVGAGANLSVEIELLFPVGHDVQERYLVPFLGRTFLEELVQDFNDNDLTGSKKHVIPLAQRVVANLIIAESVAVFSVQFSNAGILRSESEHGGLKTAYRYQEAAFKKAHLEAGFEAMDALLEYLSKNADDYASWRDSAEAKNHRSLFLNLASQFRRAIGIQITRQTFTTLLPIIQEAQNFGFEAWLPNLFFQDWKDKLLGGTLPSSDLETEALDLLRAAIAHFSMMLGVERQWIQLSGGSVIERETYVEQGSFSEKTAGTTNVRAVKMSHQLAADRYSARLRAFFEKHVADFPLLFDIASGGTNTESEAWTTAAYTASIEPPVQNSNAGKAVFLG